MNAKVAAVVILIYSVLLFLGAVWGAILGRDFSIYTIPISALLTIGPAIGIYRRANWCRIFMGVCFASIFALCLSFAFRANFVFRPIYLGILLGSGLPVFLLFFYRPLKDYTRKLPSEGPSASQ